MSSTTVCKKTDINGLKRRDLVRLNFLPDIDIIDLVEANNSQKRRLRDSNAIFYGLVVQESRNSSGIQVPVKFLIIAGVDSDNDIDNSFRFRHGERIVSLLDSLPGRNKHQRHIPLNRTLKFNPSLLPQTFFATREVGGRATNLILGQYARLISEETTSRITVRRKPIKVIRNFLSEENFDLNLQTQNTQQGQISLSKCDESKIRFQNIKLSKLKETLSSSPALSSISVDCLRKLIGRAERAHRECSGILDQSITKHEAHTAFQLVSRMAEDEIPVTNNSKISIEEQLNARQALISFMVETLKERQSLSLPRKRRVGERSILTIRRGDLHHAHA